MGLRSHLERVLLVMFVTRKPSAQLPVAQDFEKVMLWTGGSQWRTLSSTLSAMIIDDPKSLTTPTAMQIENEEGCHCEPLVLSTMNWDLILSIIYSIVDGCSFYNISATFFGIDLLFDFKITNANTCKPMFGV